MPSVCHDIKQEYEKLQDLKQKFVSVCAEAGDMDALSKSELVRLKKLKRTLEQARDAIENKIENKETRMWKNAYKEIISAVVEDSGPYHGMRIGDLIVGNDFQKLLTDYLLHGAREAQGEFGSFLIWPTVTSFNAALKLGLMKEEDRARVRELIDTDAFRSELLKSITDITEEGKKSGAAAFRAASEFHAAVELGLLQEKDQEHVWVLIDEGIFKINFEHNICSDAEIGKKFGGNVWAATVSMPTALRMRLLTEDGKKIIDELMQGEEFQKKIIDDTIADAKFGVVDDGRALNAVLVLNAIKELIELLRHRRGQ